MSDIRKTAEAILSELPDDTETVEITWPHKNPQLMNGEFISVADLKALARDYLDTRELLDKMKAEKVAAYKQLAQNLGFVAETD